ncbi:MAG TPA: zinc ribbon domain-containing protein [Gaiellaceae bacterium]
MDLAFAAVHWFGPWGLTAVWLGSISWTAADARRRCSRRAARAAISGAALLPFAGAALYALLRPCREEQDDRARRVWRRYLEAELDAGERCLVCLTPLRPDFRSCPGCGESLRADCRSCGAPLRFGWVACPHCLAPAQGSARRSRRAAPVAA